MPRMSVSFRTESYRRALNSGLSIPWQEIVVDPDVIAGELRTDESDECCQAPIKSISLQGSEVLIEVHWVLGTDMDEDGDPVGDYMPERWHVVSKLPVTVRFSVPPMAYKGRDVAMNYYAGVGAFASENWAVRGESGAVVSAGGSTVIYPASFAFRGCGIPRMRGLAELSGWLSMS